MDSLIVSDVMNEFKSYTTTYLMDVYLYYSKKLFTLMMDGKYEKDTDEIEVLIKDIAEELRARFDKENKK